ncbi:MAG: pre-toxin TG domain-containing protein [Oligoflexia bacterium]|nr:pre-toxin TG domain-containing protein [Oligoflexia bacterium]
MAIGQRIKKESEDRAAEAARDRDKIDNFYKFKTPSDLRHIKPWRNLRAAREKQLRTMEWLERQPKDLPFRAERESLIGYADLLIEAADQSYYEKDNESAEHLLELTRQSLDTVMDFLPGVSLTKDAISVMTGINPITQEKLSDIERSMLVANMFVPAVLSGTTKSVSKAAKILSKIVKEGLPARAINAGKMIDIIKSADRYIHSSLGSPESIRPMLKEVGAISDKMIDSAEKLGLKTVGEIEDLVKILGSSAKDNSERALKNIDNYIESARLGSGPQLPSRQIKNFKNQKYFNRKLDEDEIFYRYHGENNREGRKFIYATKIEYIDEQSLRNGAAILDEWGVTITSKSKIQAPSGSWVSEGLAAAQKGELTSEMRIGGEYQSLFATPDIPVSWILNTTKAF